jgi:hypothetical protein
MLRSCCCTDVSYIHHAHTPHRKHPRGLLQRKRSALHTEARNSSVTHDAVTAGSDAPRGGPDSRRGSALSLASLNSHNYFDSVHGNGNGSNFSGSGADSPQQQQQQLTRRGSGRSELREGGLKRGNGRPRGGTSPKVRTLIIVILVLQSHHCNYVSLRR